MNVESCRLSLPRTLLRDRSASSMTLAILTLESILAPYSESLRPAKPGENPQGHLPEQVSWAVIRARGRIASSWARLFNSRLAVWFTDSRYNPSSLSLQPCRGFHYGRSSSEVPPASKKHPTNREGSQINRHGMGGVLLSRVWWSLDHGSHPNLSLYCAVHCYLAYHLREFPYVGLEIVKTKPWWFPSEELHGFRGWKLTWPIH